MRLITSFELAAKSEKELSELFRKVSQKAVTTRRGTPERRNALGTLENISRARAARMCCP